MSMARLSSGGLVDRSAPVSFAWNGEILHGYAGDTLASALLANGVSTVARSFKYHRRRGVVAAGAEEPNALVQVGRGAHTVPNLKATQVELYDGLTASSVNCWPSLEFDVGVINNFVSRLLMTPTSNSRASTTRRSCGRQASGTRTNARFVAPPALAAHLSNPIRTPTST